MTSDCTKILNNAIKIVFDESGPILIYIYDLKSFTIGVKVKNYCNYKLNKLIFGS